MANKFMYIPNDDSQNYPLQLVVETFGHWTKWTNQSKFNKSPQGFQSYELENVIIRLWGLL